jgi:hypothetical protein
VVARNHKRLRIVAMSVALALLVCLHVSVNTRHILKVAAPHLRSLTAAVQAAAPAHSVGQFGIAGFRG